jgi:hypothetical protein
MARLARVRSASHAGYKGDPYLLPELVEQTRLVGGGV